MAGGASTDYSYPPSGSTSVFVDLANTRPSSQPSSRISSRAGSSVSWHPKLTLYRLLVIFSSVGLAAAKTATSYLNLTFASITLEWILGVVVFLFFHLLGAYEETNNRYLTWLFNVDYLEYLWRFLEKLTGFRRPHYVSDEIDARHRATGIHPLVTGYRIIVTVVVASVGMTKSALLYGQQPMEATTVECVSGVGIVTGLYLLSLYEASSTEVYPKLFHVDYSGGLSYISETAIVFFHLFALLVCSAISYWFYIFTARASSPEVAAKVGGTGMIETIVMAILIGIPFSAVSLGGAVGVLALMYHLCWRYRASSLGRFIARLPGIRRIPYVHQKYWLPSGQSLRPRPRFFYLKRFIVRQSVKIPLNCISLSGVIVMLALCLCLSLALYSVFMSLLNEIPWYGLLLFCLISIPLVVSIVGCTASAVHAGYNTTVDCISDAWKDFTIDIESGGVPYDEPLEGV